MYNLRVQLPSRGKFGFSHVSLRNPRISDIREFLSFAGKVDSARNSFVDSLCEESIKDLPTGDRDYLFVNIRRLINPSDIVGEFTCDNCGAGQQATLAYSDIRTDQLPDDFENPAKLTFPVSKETVILKLVTVAMEQEISDFMGLHESTDTPDTFIESLGSELELYTRYASMIQMEGKTLLEKMHYLDELDYTDFEFIMAFDISFPIGPTVAVTHPCSKCEALTRVSFPLDSDFLGMSLKSLLQKHRFLAKAGNIGFNDFLQYTSTEADTVVHEEIELKKRQARQRGK